MSLQLDARCFDTQNFISIRVIVMGVIDVIIYVILLLTPEQLWQLLCSIITRFTKINANFTRNHNCDNF